MASRADARLNPSSVATLGAVAGIAMPIRHGRGLHPAPPRHDLAIGAPSDPGPSVDLACVYDRVGAWCYSVAYRRWGDSPATAEAVEEAFLWLGRIAPHLSPDASLDDLVKLRVLQALGSTAAGSEPAIRLQAAPAQGGMS